MSRPFSVSAAMLLISALFPARAGAQVGSPGGVAAPKTLFARVAFIEAYDQNLLQSGQLPWASPLFQVSGFYSAADGRLNFQRRTARSIASLGGQATARYYHTVSSTIVDRYAVNGSYQNQIARHTTFLANVGAARRRGFARGLPGDFSGEGSETDNTVELSGLEDATFVQVPGYLVRANLSLSQQLSARSSLQVGYGAARLHLRPDFSQDRQFANVNWGQRISKAFRLNAGYRYVDVRTGNLSRSSLQMVSGGLSYGDALDRRTQLLFTGGLGAMRRDNRDQWRFVGGVQLSRRLATTWTSSVSYMSRIGYFEGIADPATYHAVRASLTGRWSQRLSSTVMSTYTVGDIGPAGDRFRIGFVSGRLSYGLSRNVGTYVMYRYYHYDFPEGRFRSIGLPETVSRNAVMVGIAIQTRTPLEP
ncbi:MAG: hypothetical protein AB7Q29_09150 [Vicinamibacterales bacterium]